MTWTECKNKYQNIQQKCMPHIHRIIDKLVIHRLILSLLGLLFYRIFIDVLYVMIISPAFPHLEFHVSLSLLRYILSMVVTVIMLLPIAALFYDDRSSSMMVLLLNLIWFIPLQTLYSIKGLSIEFYLSAMVYWLIMMGAHYLLPTIHLKPPQWNTNKLLDILAFATVTIVLFASWKYTGLRVQFDIINVYEIRAEVAQYNMGVFLGYFLSMAPILLAIFMIKALMNQKHLQAVVFFAAMYMCFSITATKKVFFFLLICIVTYFFYRRWQRWLFPIGLIALGGAGVVEYVAISSTYIVSLFFRRSMLVPIQLSSEYFNFFTNNPADLLRIGILGKLGIKTIYSGTHAQMIGWIFQNVETHANNGLVGDAIACFGLAGIIIMPIVLIIIFRVLDSCTYAHSCRITTAICIYYAITFCDGSWSTILLTNGFLVACLIMYLWKDESDHAPNRQVPLSSSQEKECHP